MKKVVLISLLAVLGISFAFGQSIYGLRGGLNISNYGGDPEMDSKIGFHGGMMMQYHLDQMLILQPELLYTQRGAQEEALGIEHKQTLHYLELPIFAKLDLGEGKLKFQPYLGPEFRYLIKGNSTLKTDLMKRQLKSKTRRISILAWALVSTSFLIQTCSLVLVTAWALPR
ncbi:MAG: porin family protein [Candidatus Cloacimonadaceae bacterium]|jgi:hypothetical protein|nr:PorT family protein [Candidatus Cloacimonadota bacterium]MDY0126718.1 porin family protein [Candidatus Cloacimonadaceae bacterium]MCB5255494.1 PorT family protein [Candidatus Cloacimonadota bacterium]MCK9178055.1 PorT family protein [Candidatus Cloacimonadota bacterium]MCK9242008.1 PorT family protein [Candidatus Cloacimonadota bacterium]